jgi:2-dehydropantoate 2-reductase
VRILMLGAGVIGSVYAGALWQQGYEIDLLARGQRLRDLCADGLILQDAESGRRSVMPVPAAPEPVAGVRYDLVIVSVRWEQLAGTLPILTGYGEAFDRSDVLFFGNTAGRASELRSALGSRALFGFPAAGGVFQGSVVRYVRIDQQKTMLGEADGTTTPRLRRLAAILDGAGFSTRISRDIDGWLLGHAAFIVPIAYALDQNGFDAASLAADTPTLRSMVKATREVFAALSAAGNAQLPANLRALYRLPTPLIVAYRRRVMAGPRGELWFAAHTRAAPTEMRSLAAELQAALGRSGRATPELVHLLGRST